MKIVRSRIHSRLTEYLIDGVIVVIDDNNINRFVTIPLSSYQQWDEIKDFQKDSRERAKTANFIMKYFPYGNIEEVGVGEYDYLVKREDWLKFLSEHKKDIMCELR